MLRCDVERVVQDTREELGLPPAGVETENELVARGGYGSPTLIVNGDDLYFGNHGLHQCVYLTVAIAADPREAFEDAQRSVAAYAAIEQYASFFEDAGFGDAAARIRRHWKADQQERASQEVDEAMARAFVIFGDAEHARREVERAAVIASTFSLSPPSWGVPLQRTAYYTAQIERAFFARA